MEFYQESGKHYSAVYDLYLVYFQLRLRKRRLHHAGRIAAKRKLPGESGLCDCTAVCTAGWGDWQASVAAITGLVAKENVVATFGILYGFAEVAEDGLEIWGTLAASFTVAAAYSFLVFNLLCAPCFAAIGAIKREMNNAKWTILLSLISVYSPM